MAHWSIFACDSRRPHFNSLARGDPLRISRRPLPLQKLGWFFVLPDSENSTIVASFVSTQYQRLTEERETDRQTRPWLIQPSCRRAVKMEFIELPTGEKKLCHEGYTLTKKAVKKIRASVAVDLAGSPPDGRSDRCNRHHLGCARHADSHRRHDRRGRHTITSVVCNSCARTDATVARVSAKSLERLDIALGWTCDMWRMSIVWLFFRLIVSNISVSIRVDVLLGDRVLTRNRC